MKYKEAFNYIDENAKKGISIFKMVQNLLDENKELKKDKEYLDKVNNEQTEVILKLNEQIEKMKCCSNCKNHKIACELNEPCEGYWAKWELEE